MIDFSTHAELARFDVELEELGPSRTFGCVFAHWFWGQNSGGPPSRSLQAAAEKEKGAMWPGKWRNRCSPK